jgi:hypothetical protein
VLYFFHLIVPFDSPEIQAMKEWNMGLSVYKWEDDREWVMENLAWMRRVSYRCVKTSSHISQGEKTRITVREGRALE